MRLRTVVPQEFKTFISKLSGTSWRYNSYANSGNGGTEPEVVNFPGACHKHFRTEAQAKSFISDWIEMFACVAKANIIKDLLAGHRPAHMQEWSLQFEWKKDADEVEREISDSIRSIKLGNSK